uniref:Uncharacterized protein n=1 Tax=Anguilla anguilla TaxID=7936 RepID=A0A0E9S9G8_ANGAN
MVIFKAQMVPPRTHIAQTQSVKMCWRKKPSLRGLFF